MGAGCSTQAAASELQSETTTLGVPPRPAYLAGDLVGPPVIEKVNIGPVDILVGQAFQFAETLCSLNDSLSGLLLDVRLATGLLQGGFSLVLNPSPNVDIFSVELLSAVGRPLDVTEAARLRGMDLTRQGRLAALDAQLAQRVVEVVDYFVRRVDQKNAALSLSPSGTLKPRASGQVADPVVHAFNDAMLDMRSALGENYLLALHLHKARAHGVPAFRAQLLKPGPSAGGTTTVGLSPPDPASAGAAPPGAASLGAGTAAAAAATASGSSFAGARSALPAWQPATLLDQAACLNASRLHDGLHAFYDANGRLAAALKEAGLTHPEAVVLSSPRNVVLAGTAAAPEAPAASTIASVRRHRHRHKTSRPSTDSAGSSRRSGGPAAAKAPPTTGAAAVRALPAAWRAVVARAVEGLNAAAHALGHAAAAAPGPASFAALVTHVLGELRDLVAQAGGDPALDAFQPSVQFSTAPNQTIAFHLDPHLDALRAAGWVRNIPPFPDCLSGPVRRAWLLLQELLRLHNSAVTQLESLGQLATAFEAGIRARVATVAEDAAAARLFLSEAAASAKALLRNHVEIRDCCQGALHTLAATTRLVREELAEAAQLANVQCSLMSPMAWSISIASSSLGAATATGASTASPTSSAAANSCASSPMASRPSNSSPSVASRSPTSATQAASPFKSSLRGSARNGFGPDPVAAARAPGSPPDVASRPDQLQQPPPQPLPMLLPQPLPMPPPEPLPMLLPEPLPLPRLSSRHLAASSPSQSPGKVTSRAASLTLPPASRTPSMSPGGCGGVERRSSVQQYDNDRLMRSQDSQAGGWLPADGRDAAWSGDDDDGGGGEQGGGASKGRLRPAQSAAQAAAAAEAGAGAGPVSGSRWLWRSGQSLGSRSRAERGGESLAEEYARTALAHLRL